MNNRPGLSKTFIQPIFYNCLAVMFGLFLTATPYMAQFYADHPEFRAAAFALGPITVLIALANMVGATLNSVKHLGTRPFDDE